MPPINCRHRKGEPWETRGAQSHGSPVGTAELPVIASGNLESWTELLTVAVAGVWLDLLALLVDLLKDWR